MTGNSPLYPGASSGAGTREGWAAPRRKPDCIPRSRAARIAAACWVLLAQTGALAQTGPTLIGVGTSLSAPFRLARIAPGDIVTLQVVGLKTVLPGPVKATSPPLPKVLAGISVLMSQADIAPGRPRPLEAVPLFSIEQRKLCDSPPPDCTMTSITIHVPRVSDRGDYPYVTVAISENGVDSRAFSLDVRPVDILVLTSCSSGVDGFCGAQVPAVTHADGSLVTASSPAKPGEMIVIYATGLGLTEPPLPSGQATPAPAPTASNRFYIQFDFRPNAGPTFPYDDPFGRPFAPEFAAPQFIGLTPGQIGVFQINVRIPDTIPQVPPCHGLVTARWGVLSNLTITVSSDDYNTSNNVGGAAICVAPPQ